MAQPILVVIEHGARGINPASWEVITAGQALGEALGLPVEAVVLEGVESDTVCSQVATRQLAGVRHAVHSGLVPYTPETQVQALVQVITAAEPDYVLFPHTYQARDYVPQLATRMARGLISDATGFRVESGRVVLTRQMFQGKLAADVVFAGETPHFVSFQIGAFRGDKAVLTTAPAPIEKVSVAPSPPLLQPGEPFQEAKQAVDLSKADLIVSVGRGIKEPKNLDLVRELAQVLGAELAASRPICDSGWLPMDRQIGSSGQTVSPKLYLAVGISGAIQHLVGMKGARTIVAINKDPEAPIFEVADYGVVGNLFEVVPALIEEIKKRKG